MPRLTSRDAVKPGERLTLHKSGTDHRVKVLDVMTDGRIRVQYIVGRRTDLRGTYARADLYR